ncbi:MAG: hypothetical protein LBM70_07365, partial [Victivallales bacterium]|nr:hypothetical protein [Victivallales bacterium]
RKKAIQGDKSTKATKKRTKIVLQLSLDPKEYKRQLALSQIQMAFFLEKILNLSLKRLIAMR